MLAPLLRAQLATTPHGSLLVLVAHRIALDEQSLDLLARSLCLLHEGESAHQHAHHHHHHDHHHASFGDFAAWQAQVVSDAAPAQLESARVGFFDEHLKGNLPVLQLPIDFPRPPTPSFVCRSVTHKVDAALGTMSVWLLSCAPCVLCA